MKKRILSILLAAVMVMAVLPISIWAEESAAHEHTVCNNSNICSDPTHIDSHGENTWNAHTDDNAMPASAGDYYLSKNVTLSDTWVISGDTKSKTTSC